ncbi:MAG: cytochrome-c oxidase, cbb3-type subunit II [Gammaproteobacteria bacterium]|nr:cytochrome-c oxidase, cbb3-type subunit II [Gammaproteobacteria bacterium]
MNHEKIEKNVGLMGVLIALVISIGGLVQIVPLYFQGAGTHPAPGVKPYPALNLAGRDVYIREGCYVCHSQMIRPFRSETERYGPYSLAGESVYDHPFQFGSKRTGPDLARVGGRYTDDWHRVHLMNPRDVVPQSNMPRFPWLAEARVDGALTAKKMEALRAIGVPYSDADIAGAAAAVEGKSELDALVAYLQGLGTNLKTGS